MNSTGKNPDDKRNILIKRIAPVILVFYFLILLLLFLGELSVFNLQQHFRATTQVLLLLALLILPFLVLFMSRYINSLTLKFSGQELYFELSELRDEVTENVDRVESNLLGQISTAEQALWPLLAGIDNKSDERLREKKLIIGSKEDVSQVFFAHLLEQAIEKFVPGAQCEVRVPNGGSLKNFADVKYRWIDMYIDFTGTCCQYFNIDHHGKTEDEIIDELNFYGKSIDLRWMAPLGASEDYCLVMKKEIAEKHNIDSIQELKIKGPALVFSGDPEFLNRKDCFLGLQKYGVDFKQVKTCHVTERYDLLAADEADVFVGYETDPELLRGDIIRLKDPDQFFPRYMATPLVNTHALEQIPELEMALQKLQKSITTQELIMEVNKLSAVQSHPSVARDNARAYVNRVAEKDAN